MNEILLRLQIEHTCYGSGMAHSILLAFQTLQSPIFNIYTPFIRFYFVCSVGWNSPDFFIIVLDVLSSVIL